MEPTDFMVWQLAAYRRSYGTHCLYGLAVSDARMEPTDFMVWQLAVYRRSYGTQCLYGLAVSDARMEPTVFMVHPEHGGSRFT